MMTGSIAGRFCLLCSIAITALAGCSSAPMRYYTLQPMPGSQSGRAVYNGPALQVNIVHIPPELDRNELMREVTPGRFEIREFDRWIGPLGRMARQTLSEDLALRLPAGSLIYPDAHPPAGVVSISIDVLSFRTEGPTATMQVSWGTRVAGLLTPSGCGGQLDLRTPLGDPQGTGTPVAFSALLGELADSISGQLAAGCISTVPVF